MEDTAPFQIHAKTNAPQGYTETVCVQCKNKDQAINQDKIVVDVETECAKSLSVNKEAISVT